MKDNIIYPVIDLFAGPGGLGEGFASLRYPENPGHYAFRTAISIEKEPFAHRTLQLRHFYRAFPPDAVPDHYYRYIEVTITLEELYSYYPEAACHAEHTAWLCELGEEPHENVKYRNGKLQMASLPVDVSDLMTAFEGVRTRPFRLPPETQIGHVHLHVDHISQAIRFYHDQLGMQVMFQIPTAAFLAYDGYHHHIGVNTWAGKVPHSENYQGLHQVTLVLSEKQQGIIAF